jgi:TPR repeat protein
MKIRARDIAGWCLSGISAFFALCVFGAFLELPSMLSSVLFFFAFLALAAAVNPILARNYPLFGRTWLHVAAGCVLSVALILEAYVFFRPTPDDKTAATTSESEPSQAAPRDKDAAPKPDEDSLEQVTARAEQGDTKAQTRLADAYADGDDDLNVQPDKAKAFYWYRKLGDAGDASAAELLGEAFDVGRDKLGVEKDATQALYWYRKAAEAGDATAMYNVAHYYDDGVVVEQNPAEAARWYRKAAEAGESSAMLNLGYDFHNGIGVAQDQAEGIRWYRKAAEAGSDIAMNNLGKCYDAGTGVPKDVAEAARWYRKAAEAGNADGMFNLGYDFANGEGDGKDFAEAARWYRKAANAGDPKVRTRALENLRLIER